MRTGERDDAEAATRATALSYHKRSLQWQRLKPRAAIRTTPAPESCCAGSVQALGAALLLLTLSASYVHATTTVLDVAAQAGTYKFIEAVKVRRDHTSPPSQPW